MARLRQIDLRRLLGAAAELAAVADGDALAPTLYRVTVRLIPTDRFTYNELTPDPRGKLLIRRNVQEPFTPPAAWVERYNRFAQEHPCLSAMRRPGGGAVKFSDFITLRQLRRRGIYQEYFRLAGTDRQLMIAFRAHDGTTITAGFNRQGRDFTEEERAALDLLQTHVVSAHHRAGVLANLAATPPDGPAAGERLRRCLRLTPREADVLVWLSQGKTNSEIGLILALGRSTVKTHVERLFAKLGCETRTAAARTALETLAGQAPPRVSA